MSKSDRSFCTLSLLSRILFLRLASMSSSRSSASSMLSSGNSSICRSRWISDSITSFGLRGVLRMAMSADGTPTPFIPFSASCARACICSARYRALTISLSPGALTSARSAWRTNSSDVFTATIALSMLRGAVLRALDAERSTPSMARSILMMACGALSNRNRGSTKTSPVVSISAQVPMSIMLGMLLLSSSDSILSTRSAPIRVSTTSRNMMLSWNASMI